MKGEKVTAHDHCPFHVARKELKCEPLTTVDIAWRSDSLGINGSTVLFSKGGDMDTTCPKTSVSVLCAGRSGVLCCDSFGHRRLEASISESELCARCFCQWKCHICLTFGSPLETGNIASFEGTRGIEVSIPGGVRELCDQCFKGCSSLLRVIFGASSSLERIGVSCFEMTGIKEVSIPDSVHELCDQSSLERIGVSCFEESGVEEVSVPDGVRELCDGCFRGCSSLRRVTFGPSSSLERIGVEAFGPGRDSYGHLTTCGLVEINIPDSVRELCDKDKCFYWGCLRRVTFGSSSLLERIGVSCFEMTGIKEVSIPDSVLELCDNCFKACSRLHRVIFGSSSLLQRIGVETFGGIPYRKILCGIVEIYIPDSVRELCDGCFQDCHALCRVTFGPASCLERIGVKAFSTTEDEDPCTTRAQSKKSISPIVSVNCVVSASNSALVFVV